MDEEKIIPSIPLLASEMKKMLLKMTILSFRLLPERLSRLPASGLHHLFLPQREKQIEFKGVTSWTTFGSARPEHASDERMGFLEELKKYPLLRASRSIVFIAEC